MKQGVWGAVKHGWVLRRVCVVGTAQLELGLVSCYPHSAKRTT